MDQPCEPCGQLALAGGGAGWQKTGAASCMKMSGSSRGLRGGSWLYNGSYLTSSSRSYGSSSSENNNNGFRVASSELTAVPEPTSLLSTLALISSGLLLRRRAKALR